MNHCPRCRGLVVQQYEETRCLLCGWRLNEPLPVTPRDPYMRKEKCIDCLAPREAGYTHCPKCRAWKKRVAEEKRHAIT